MENPVADSSKPWHRQVVPELSFAAPPFDEINFAYAKHLKITALDEANRTIFQAILNFIPNGFVEQSALLSSTSNDLLCLDKCYKMCSPGKNKLKKYTYTKKKQKTIFERMFQNIHFKD